jgi:hypothetical protein
VSCNGKRGSGRWPTGAKTGPCPAAVRLPWHTVARSGGAGSSRTPAWPAPLTSSARKHRARSLSGEEGVHVLCPDWKQLSVWVQHRLVQALSDLARAVCGIMWVIFDHHRPPGHIMPDHAGDRGAALLVLAPHDHLHIKQIRTPPEHAAAHTYASFPAHEGSINSSRRYWSPRVRPATRRRKNGTNMAYTMLPPTIRGHGQTSRFLAQQDLGCFFRPCLTFVQRIACAAWNGHTVISCPRGDPAVGSGSNACAARSVMPSQRQE